MKRKLFNIFKNIFLLIIICLICCIVKDVIKNKNLKLEDNSIDDVRGKIEKLLINYNEKENFENYMEDALQVNLTENEKSYTLVLDKYKIEVTSSEIVSINEIGISVNSIYDSIEDMKKDKEIKLGDFLRTKGYYSENLGGGAYYDIVELPKSECDNVEYIELDNGLCAKLHVIDDTITVNQFGAYGNGLNDDTYAIQKALDSEYSNILFESSEYKVTETLNIFRSNINIFGNNATLFTDNDFQYSKEWFLRVRNDNINIYSLNVEARETIDVGYKTQLGIMRSKNILVQNCTFVVPETAEQITSMNSDKEYTNIDLFSGWEDIKITNCTLEVLHNGGAGGCIWIRDLGELGGSNLEFSNNYCHKICHDEILGIYKGYIKDIKIINNKFKIDEKDGIMSSINFTIGTSDTFLCDNILIQGNEMEAVSESVFLSSANATNVNINNNTIKYAKSAMANTSNYVFRNKSSEINLIDNDIYIYNNKLDNAMVAFYGENLNVVNNKIKINTNMSDVFSNCSKISNNDIVIYGDCINLINNLSRECVKNKIELNGQVKHMFQWFYTELINDINIEENIIYYNYEEIKNNVFSFFSIINQTLCNKNIIKFVRNNVIGKEINSKGYLIFFSAVDDTPQTIFLEANQFDSYDKRYVSIVKDGVEKNIIYENHVILEYSTRELTNEDVEVRLKSDIPIEMTSSNVYTFTKNGSFTFRFTLNGEEKEMIATVDWIDKDAPIITGFEDRVDELEVATIKVTDDNLDTIVVTRNGGKVDFNNGDTLFESGDYEVVATDKAKNSSTAVFRIVDYIESNKTYYISQNGSGDGLSERTPMNLVAASKLRYYAGDKILFKASEIYNVDLDWSMMGSPSNRITISSFSGGNRPVINGHISVVSNMDISNLNFNNSNDSCLVTNQSYCENVSISNCVFDNIGDTGIYLNRQVDNFDISNCIFRNCKMSGISIKNDNQKFIASNIKIHGNVFVCDNVAIMISGAYEDENFDEIEVYDNAFLNQTQEEASMILFGVVKDTEFDVNVYNNIFYNFARVYKAGESQSYNLKNNLRADGNTFYSIENSKFFNECSDFDSFKSDYLIDKNSTNIVMNEFAYQIDLVSEVSNNSFDKNEILAYMTQTILHSDSSKEVIVVDTENNVVLATSGFDQVRTSKVGSIYDLGDKNSQEKIEDVTVSEEKLPLTGWKKAAITVIVILLVMGLFSGLKYEKYKKDTKKQIRK